MTVAGYEELAFAGVARPGDLLRAGEVTPRELVELYLARIERLNPRLNAFVSIRTDKALVEADAALKRLRAGEAGALLGVPVALKDNVDIAGEVTTHGPSQHPRCRPPPRSSRVNTPSPGADTTGASDPLSHVVFRREQVAHR